MFTNASTMESPNNGHFGTSKSIFMIVSHEAKNKQQYAMNE